MALSERLLASVGVSEPTMCQFGFSHTLHADKAPPNSRNMDQTHQRRGSLRSSRTSAKGCYAPSLRQAMATAINSFVLHAVQLKEAAVPALRAATTGPQIHLVA